MLIILSTGWLKVLQDWLKGTKPRHSFFASGFTPNVKRKVQGVQEKLCFFTIHCIPSFAYIAVRDLQSFQRNASVHFTE